MGKCFLFPFFFFEIFEEKRQNEIFVWQSEKTIFLESDNRVANEEIVHLSSDLEEKQSLNNSEIRYKYYYSFSCSRGNSEEVCSNSHYFTKSL